MLMIMGPENHVRPACKAIDRQLVRCDRPAGTLPALRCSMDQRARYTEALRAAADTLGGCARLAVYLRVPRRKVEGWLAGQEIPPLGAFLGALDVIADGPFAPQPHPVRVAVLPDEPAH